MPRLILCKSTSSNAGIESAIRGTNQAVKPIEGFVARLWDEEQNNRRKTGKDAGKTQSTSLPSGTVVEFFEFELEPNTRTSNSEDVDNGARPLYQHYLQVEREILPRRNLFGDSLAPSESPGWAVNTLAFSNSKAVPRVLLEGYHVGKSLEAAIQDCFRRDFRLEASLTKVGPSSASQNPAIHLRISSHPVHETYISASLVNDSTRFHGSLPRGVLAADLLTIREALPGMSTKVVRRVQTGFTRSIQNLLREWGVIGSS